MRSIRCPDFFAHRAIIALRVAVLAAGTLWLALGVSPAQYGAPIELRNMTPTIEDAAPGHLPGPEAKLVPEVYRRQPVLYRTSELPGTIIIDTSRRFLYLIQPNNTRCATASASGVTVFSGMGCCESRARRNGRTGRRRRK